MIRTRRVLALGLSFLTALSVAGTALAAEVNLALGKKYTVTIWTPNEDYQKKHEIAYPDTDGKELTDGQYAELDFKHAGWVGFLRQDGRSIVIDLESAANVASVVVSALSNPSVGINPPDYVEVSFSTDGKSWSQPASAKMSKLPMDAGKVTFTYTGAVSARYVKVDIPASVWIFVDEIEVKGTK